MLECVRDDGAAGVMAFFGFDNPTAAPAALPIGPANFFDPPPADRGNRPGSREGAGRSIRACSGWSSMGNRSAGWGWMAGAGPPTRRLPSRTARCPCWLPEWLFATIEPPLGHDPASIDPASVLLGGIVPADLAYQALVDLDGDGQMERKVRFAQTDVRLLLFARDRGPYRNGRAGLQTFAGGGAVGVADPKAGVQAWPNVLSQSQPADGTAWLTLRGCFASAGIDVRSVRLNGTVPVARVIGIEGGVLKLAAGPCGGPGGPALG